MAPGQADDEVRPAAQKRERNAKDTKGTAKSQLKANQKALNIQCDTCKATFLSTTRETAYVLPGPFPKSDALLDRRCHRVGEFRGGVAQGVIPGGDGGLHTRAD